MTTILKLQRPLGALGHGADEPQPWLLYSRNRKHFAMVPDDKIEPAIRAAMGDDAKGYFEGSVSPGGVWQIGRRVTDQDW